MEKNLNSKLIALTGVFLIVVGVSGIIIKGAEDEKPRGQTVIQPDIKRSPTISPTMRGNAVRECNRELEHRARNSSPPFSYSNTPSWKVQSQTQIEIILTGSLLRQDMRYNTYGNLDMDETRVSIRCSYNMQSKNLTLRVPRH